MAEDGGRSYCGQQSGKTQKSRSTGLGYSIRSPPQSLYLSPGLAGAVCALSCR